MSAYFIANIEINDPLEYEKYLEGCDQVLAQFGGEYLAVDDRPGILEGVWNYTRVVLIRFPTEEDLRRWYDSPEYRDILKFRLASARCDTLAVRGKA
jgi:uncharacterized protein (DUF1330 family)